MACAVQRSLLFLALSILGLFLQGCTFGTESQSCDGRACSCDLTFRSFWARIQISGVHIEHVSSRYSIPDVANDTNNGSMSPCCDAIFDQIDYDQGKTPSMPSKTVDSLASSCAKSPNKEISKVAISNNTSSVDGVAALSVRRLRSSQPIDDGEVGQDCEFDGSKGFKLNGSPITSGSMKLVIRWVDPKGSTTPCCNALQPLLSHLYIDDRSESALPNNVKDSFCQSCRLSSNNDIALAAYRCFGGEVNDTVLA